MTTAPQTIPHTEPPDVELQPLDAPEATTPGAGAENGETAGVEETGEQPAEWDDDGLSEGSVVEVDEAHSDHEDGVMSTQRSTRMRYFKRAVIAVMLALDGWFLTAFFLWTWEKTDGYEIILLVGMSPVAYGVVYVQSNVRDSLDAFQSLQDTTGLGEDRVVTLSGANFMVRTAGVETMWVPELLSLQSLLRLQCGHVIPSCSMLCDDCGHGKRWWMFVPLVKAWLLFSAVLYFIIPPVVRVMQGQAVFSTNTPENIMIVCKVVIGGTYIALLYRLFMHFIEIFQTCCHAVTQFTQNTHVHSVESLQGWVLTFEQYRLLFRELSKMYSLPILLVVLWDIFVTIQVLALPATVPTLIFVQLLLVSTAMNTGAVAVLYFVSKTNTLMLRALTNLLCQHVQTAIDTPSGDPRQEQNQLLFEAVSVAVGFLQRQHLGFELLLANGVVKVPMSRTYLLSLLLLGATNIYATLKQIWDDRVPKIKW